MTGRAESQQSLLCRAGWPAHLGRSLDGEAVVSLAGVDFVGDRQEAVEQLLGHLHLHIALQAGDGGAPHVPGQLPILSVAGVGVGAVPLLGGSRRRQRRQRHAQQERRRCYAAPDPAAGHACGLRAALEGCRGGAWQVRQVGAWWPGGSGGPPGRRDARSAVNRCHETAAGSGRCAGGGRGAVGVQQPWERDAPAAAGNVGRGARLAPYNNCN